VRSGGEGATGTDRLIRLARKTASVSAMACNLDYQFAPGGDPPLI
jgi:hypothetical protein